MTSIIKPETFIAAEEQPDHGYWTEGTVEVTLRNETRRMPAKISPARNEITAYGFTGRYETGTVAWPASVTRVVDPRTGKPWDRPMFGRDERSGRCKKTQLDFLRMTDRKAQNTEGETEMTRYIIQDRYTGYIWGDTGDLDGPARSEEPIEACQRLDESVGDYGRTYRDVSRLSGDSGYTIYRADINGSEAVPIVQDGQDRDYIEAVERDCELVGYVEWALPE